MSERVKMTLLALLGGLIVASVAYMDARDAQRGLSPACVEAGRCPAELRRQPEVIDDGCTARNAGGVVSASVRAACTQRIIDEVRQ